MKIFAKFKPTFGDESKSFASSGGAGVASVSPVAVRTTPFIAEGKKSLGVGRCIGVSREAIRTETGVGCGRGVGCMSFRRRERWTGVASAVLG